jgi:hypothetical protein
VCDTIDRSGLDAESNDPACALIHGDQDQGGGRADLLRA